MWVTATTTVVVDVVSRGGLSQPPPGPGLVPATPGGPPGPGLAHTGFGLTVLLLLLAAVLIVVGVALVVRASRRPVTEEPEVLPMPHRSRPLRVLSLTSLFLLALSGLALAQSSTTVSVTLGAGSRQLAVTDVSGNPLTELALRPGTPTTFRVRVSDTDYLATQGFTVQSTLNNLYRVTDAGYDYATSIPSGNVQVSYPTSPISTALPAVDLNPRYLVGSVGSIDCAKVSGLLGLDLLQQATDPLCTLLNGLTGSALNVADVPLPGTPLGDIDLAGLLPGELPIAITGGSDMGAYTQPDCVNGIGAGAGCSGGGTPRTYLRGTPPAGALNDALRALLEGKALSTPLASADGSGAIASTASVVQALQASANTTVADFGNRLTSYTGAQQLTLVNGLLQAVLDAINGANLANITGQYHGFPQLSVDPGTAPAGRYAGTLTVTLVE